MLIKVKLQRVWRLEVAAQSDIVCANMVVIAKPGIHRGGRCVTAMSWCLGDGAATNGIG